MSIQYLKHQGCVHVGATLTSSMFTFKKRGFITLLTKKLTKKHHTQPNKKVRHDVRIKPIFKKMTSERFEQRTANTMYEAIIRRCKKGILASRLNSIFDAIVS